jgi:hypothetical protein
MMPVRSLHVVLRAEAARGGPIAPSGFASRVREAATLFDGCEFRKPKDELRLASDPLSVRLPSRMQSLRRWRSGSFEQRHDTPPQPFMPSPTFANSSSLPRARASKGGPRCHILRWTASADAPTVGHAANTTGGAKPLALEATIKLLIYCEFMVGAQGLEPWRLNAMTSSREATRLIIGFAAQGERDPELPAVDDYAASARARQPWAWRRRP